MPSATPPGFLLVAGTTLAAALLAAAPAAAQTRDASRGELLYRNHCIECHTSKMHWRDQRLATDWPTLVRQVSRWQGEARLAWGSDEIHDVARHLNETIYRFPVGGPRAQVPARAAGG